tara:strand:+ start:382 stop:513 length:132 start_codon:yes stop_codon:yes gene_type:complete
MVCISVALHSKLLNGKIETFPVIVARFKNWLFFDELVADFDRE